jgi:hypothetical protein
MGWIDKAASSIAARSLDRRGFLHGAAALTGTAVLSGTADRASATCPACGNCSTLTIHSSGQATIDPCATKCQTAKLCQKAQSLSQYKALDKALRARGFKLGSPQKDSALELVYAKKLLGTALLIEYVQASRPSETASLTVWIPASGTSQFYATAWKQQVFLYVMQIVKGKLVVVKAPKVALPSAKTAALADEPSIPAGKLCMEMAGTFCAWYIGLAAGALGAVVCAALGAESLGAACVAAFALVSQIVRRATGVCESFTKFLCVAPDFVWCNCNDTCYYHGSTCLNNCEVSLGCFTGICEPIEASTQCHAINYH